MATLLFGLTHIWFVDNPYPQSMYKINISHYENIYYYSLGQSHSPSLVWSVNESCWQL